RLPEGLAITGFLPRLKTQLFFNFEPDNRVVLRVDGTQMLFGRWVIVKFVRLRLSHRAIIVDSALTCIGAKEERTRRNGDVPLSLEFNVDFTELCLVFCS